MRYTNLDGTTPDKGPLDLLRWQVVDRLTGKRKPDRTAFEPPRRSPEPHVFAEAQNRLGWVGHATFALRLGGQMLLTDPVWSSKLHTIRRVSAPGFPLQALPPIDVVTVSHSHYDHMDMPTLRRIGPEATYVVPKDNGELLIRAGLPRVVELEWWETTRFGELEITLVPAHHWSMRTPLDKNKRLWGGFVYRSCGVSLYHAGDTAFREDVFRTIGERFSGLDFAMLPIGAYDPPWFMQPQHMGPEEAARAFDLLGARVFCAMHWGTFQLTDEPLGEPPARLRRFFEERGWNDERLWVPDLGESRTLAL